MNSSGCYKARQRFAEVYQQLLDGLSQPETTEPFNGRAIRPLTEYALRVDDVINHRLSGLALRSLRGILPMPQMTMH